MFKLFYVFAQDSVISRFKYFTDGIHSKYLYYCCICKFLKELLSIVSFETWCKGKDFYFYLPNFFESFFSIYFFGSFFRNDFRTFAWIFQPHPSVYLFPSFLTSLSSCHHRISLDCGCKSTAVKHIFQMFCQLFSIYFLLYLIVSDLQIHFSPFFWLPLFLFYFSFLNSQKAGVFLSFRAGFSAKDAGFFSFYAYLFKTNKRESISILTGSVFDSRLV